MCVVGAFTLVVFDDKKQENNKKREQNFKSKLTISTKKSKILHVPYVYKLLSHYVIDAWVDFSL